MPLFAKKSKFFKKSFLLPINSKISTFRENNTFLLNKYMNIPTNIKTTFLEIILKKWILVHISKNINISAFIKIILKNRFLSVNIDISRTKSLFWDDFEKSFLSISSQISICRGKLRYFEITLKKSFFANTPKNSNISRRRYFFLDSLKKIFANKFENINFHATPQHVIVFECASNSEYALYT